MNKVLRSTLWTILVTLALIGLVAFIATLYGVYVFYRHARAIKHATVNDIQCPPKLTCGVTVTELPIPSSKHVTDSVTAKKYNKEVATYCIDLLARLVVAEEAQVPAPKGLKEEVIMYNYENDPPVGMLWSKDDIVWLAFRGTVSSSGQEWAQDFTYTQSPFPPRSNKNQQDIFHLQNVAVQPSVHSGYLQIYNKFRTAVLDKLQTLKPKVVVVTGHSLGAGVATLCSTDLANNGYETVAYTIASPRVGDQVFCDLIKSLDFPLFRVVNSADIIPTTPPSVVPNFNDYTKPYFYQHCGTALTFTDNWKSIVNNHQLPVYINAIRTKAF